MCTAVQKFLPDALTDMPKGSAVFTEKGRRAEDGTFTPNSELPDNMRWENRTGTRGIRDNYQPQPKDVPLPGLAGQAKLAIQKNKRTRRQIMDEDT